MPAMRRNGTKYLSVFSSIATVFLGEDLFFPVGRSAAEGSCAAESLCAGEGSVSNEAQPGEIRISRLHIIILSHEPISFTF